MLDFAIRLGKRAGAYLRDHLRDELTIERKGRVELVTNIDRLSERLIVSEIERAFPDHGICAEEGTLREGTAPWTWVIDPLDGTTNFIHRIPFFCVSIAVLRGGRPHTGVCCSPLSGDTFWAQDGGGAYLNGDRLHVSRTGRLCDALVATGFPYDAGDVDTLMKRFSRVLKRARGIRRFGSAALDLCFVASGAFDAFWEQGLKPWDVAAGAIILQEAGGIVTCLDGGPLDLYRGDILASNALVHDELRQCMDDGHD